MGRGSGHRSVVSGLLLRRHDDLVKVLVLLTSADLSGCPTDDDVDELQRRSASIERCLALRRSVTDVIGDDDDDDDDDGEASTDSVHTEQYNNTQQVAAQQ